MHLHDEARVISEVKLEDPGFRPSGNHRWQWTIPVKHGGSSGIITLKNAGLSGLPRLIAGQIP